MSGDKVIAHREGGGFSRAPWSASTSLDPATREETVLLLFANSADGELDGIGDPAEDDVVYEHGRIYFGATTV